MAAPPFALTGERRDVRLTEIPFAVREDAARKAARKWGLTGMDYMELMLAATDPRPHRPLSVDVAKIERAMAGKIIPGPIPDLPPQDPWLRR